MPRKKTVSVTAMLNAHGTLRIAKGYAYEHPYVRRSQRGKPDAQMEYRTSEVPGSGLTRYALEKFRTGAWTPRLETRKRIEAQYARLNYHKMVRGGVSRKEAAASMRKPISIIRKVVKEYKDMIADIVERRAKQGQKVKPEWIAWGMMLTRKTKKMMYDKYYRVGKVSDISKKDKIIDVEQIEAQHSKLAAKQVTLQGKLERARSVKTKDRLIREIEQTQVQMNNLGVE